MRGHPNIIQVVRHGWIETSPAYAIIDMEYCEFTLADYVRERKVFEDVVALKYQEYHLTNIRIKWLCISTIMIDICQGLQFIHGLDEVHRDLKPWNSMGYQNS